MAIGMFVDGEFLYRCYPGQLDYLKLRSFIEAEINDSIDEAYYFSSDDDNQKAVKFNDFLTVPPPGGPGFRVKTYWLSRKKLFWPASLGGQPVLHPADPSLQYELIQQKGVDVGLAFHMVRSFYKRRWSTLVLCAGDSDFHEPVQSLVEQENVDLYLVGAVRSISSELRSYARRIFSVEQEPVFSRLKR